MLVTINKLKHVVCHGSHTSQITTLKSLIMHTFFSVFNEKILEWSHASWLTNGLFRQVVKCSLTN